MKLLDILKQPEGKTLEYKRDLSSTDGFLRTVVAFANTGGGIVLIGVEDETRHITGVADPHALQERAANLIHDGVAPRVLPDMEILAYRNEQVLSVQIHPSSLRPHCLSSVGEDSGTYVRVGSTNRRADAALVAELKRYSRGESFDEWPMPDLDSEALDFRLASESFADYRQLRPGDLSTLRLITTYQNKEVPTVGGILLFGKDRLRHFPDAFVQAGRFQGTDRSVMLDHIELKGSLIEAIDEAIAFVEKHSVHGFTIGRTRRVERWSLPPAALREAVINAVAHADYSQSGAPIRLAMFDDRLEVENPGLLPFGMTVQELSLGVSKIRNRVIGRVFQELRLVEHWGTGVERMLTACRDAGLAEPEFQEIGMRFRVTFRLGQESAPQLDVTDAQIMEFICDAGGVGTKEIAAHIGLTVRATRTRLAALVDRGLLVEIGTGRHDPGRKYFAAGN